MARADKVKLAREFRREPTPSEALMWGRLRDRRLAGLKFRRQHPREGCIADFYCADKALVVEVDGGVHLTEDQYERDELRDRELRERGIWVIRFRNEEVEGNLEAVLQRIVETAQQR